MKRKKKPFRGEGQPAMQTEAAAPLGGITLGTLPSSVFDLGGWAAEASPLDLT